MKKLIVTILALGGIGMLGYSLFKYFNTQALLLKQFTYKITSIVIVKLTLTEIDINFAVVFFNQADFDVQVNALYLDIYLQGTKVGYVQDSTSFVIPSKGQTNIALSATFNPQIVLGDLTDIVAAAASFKNMSVGFHGYAQGKSGFVSATIPIDLDDTIGNLMS